MKTSAECLEWAVKTFGPCARDRKERARRFLEEALELAQAEGLDAVAAQALTWRVFSRPPGETAQEVAGVLISLACLAENAGVDMGDAYEAEWQRIGSHDAEYFRAKHAEKVRDGVAMA